MAKRQGFHTRLIMCLSLALACLAANGASAEAQQIANLGSCELENGQRISHCRLAYRSYGKLNARRSNVVLMPSWYNGSAADQAKYGYLGPGKIVDTNHYFVIAVDAFGNGLSSSPSNHPGAGSEVFPQFSIRDMVRAQYRLLTEELGFTHIHAVVGASLGGYQTYEWLMLYPHFASHFVPIEGTPWPTHYDQLLWSAWQRALAAPRATPEDRQRTTDLLTLTDALTLWTPDYVNREGRGKTFDEYLASVARKVDPNYLMDRASQTRALFTHDVRAPYQDFAQHLESLGDPRVLAIVFESDLMVNPAPNRELAAMLGFEVMSLAGDCGHMGPNPECYQDAVAERVQQFLAHRPATVAGMQRQAMIHDGISREYFVYRPQSAAADAALPVVLALHGYGSTATGFQATYALNRHAEEHGYMVVYPQGSHFMGAFGDDPHAEKFLVTTWNDQVTNFTPGPGGAPHCTQDRLTYPCPPECGSCNHCAWVSCYDDFGFIMRVLDTVQAGFTTDKARYYLLGNSNGGTLAMRLACEQPARFAAIASLLIQMPPGYACAPATSVPLLHLYGEKDDSTGHDGTPTSDGWIYTTAGVTAQTWAQGLGCAALPTPWHTAISDANKLECEAYGDCGVSGHQVVSCMDPAAGHEWRGQRLHDVPANCTTQEQRASLPGQPACPISQLNKTQWGMDLVWQFLSQYRRTDQG